MQACGWLVEHRTANGVRSRLADGMFANPVNHQRMLVDSVRMSRYSEAIRKHCGGKSVVEIGCGSGALSVLAAKAGATVVHAIEEAEIASVAEEMFRANAVDRVVRLHRGNSHDVTLNQPADVLIHELFGADPFGEGMLSALRDGRERLLKPGGSILPARLDVWCVGVSTSRWPEFPLPAMRGALQQAGDSLGLNYGPLVASLDALEPHRMRPDTLVLYEDNFEPAQLTRPALLFSIDLESDDLAAPMATTTSTQVVRPGLLNGLVVYFQAFFGDGLSLTTAPDAPKTHWGWKVRRIDSDVAVDAGASVELTCEVLGAPSFGIAVDCAVEGTAHSARRVVTGIRG
jgi:protein arginine N-methyltransferase 1